MGYGTSMQRDAKAISLYQGIDLGIRVKSHLPDVASEVGMLWSSDFI